MWAYRRGFDDRDGLDDLLLVHLRTWTVEIAHNGGHAGFVAHCCRQMDGLFGVVFGKRLDLSSMAGCPLTGEESQRAMTRCFKFPVRHLGVWLLLSMSTSSNLVLF